MTYLKSKIQVCQATTGKSRIPCACHSVVTGNLKNKGSRLQPEGCSDV